MEMQSFPPLPSPWTEHIAPSGHYYYFNPQSGESTYTRPLPISLTSALASSSAALNPKKQKKPKPKERPMKKAPIPDTLWLRVVTTRGNVFYHNTETKDSVWETPDDISSLVAALKFDDSDEDEEMEVNSKEEETNDGEKATAAEKAAPSPSIQKRKLEETETDSPKPKRKKVNEPRTIHPLPPKPSSGPTISVQDEAADEDAANQPDDEDDEEAWQRQMAEEMAEEIDMAEEEVVENMNNSKLSAEEGRKILKEIMQEKSISPMLPWESILPLISSDPRYDALNKGMHINSQRDAFEEVCKEIIQERRQTAGASSAVEAPKQTQTPLEAYQSLLSETVTSTRTTYTQFRQQVKKDRRFYSFGRDERERESAFRSYLKELGEKKKGERKKAEDEFVGMLREGTKKGLTKGKWSDVKKHFQKDKRYDAVGSSSLREELFDNFIKSNNDQLDSTGSPSRSDSKLKTDGPQSSSRQHDAEEERKRRREKAVREREEKVRMEKERVERVNAHSRAGLNQEEAELTFNSLLVDTVRDPTVSFQSAIAYLSSDPRFASINSARMPQSRLQYLFDSYIRRLQSKGASALHTLFESYAPGLDKKWTDLKVEEKESLSKSAAVKKLGLDGKVKITSRSSGRRDSRRDDDRTDDDDEEDKYEYPALRQEFEKWQRERYTEARAAFDTMLSENAFVEFWGRVGKMGVVDDEEKQRLGKMVFADETAGSAATAVDPEEIMAEGEGGGGKADLQALAKGVDVKEVMRVLRGDKRFIVFDYNPTERERWVTDHLRQLTAPKASVHIGQSK